ncbi:MAG: hypothetical protein ACE5IO_08545, partial [Thermoplasmata archaeon]
MLIFVSIFSILVTGSLVTDMHPTSNYLDDLDLLINDNDLTFAPSGSVEVNTTVSVQAVLRSKGDILEIQWTKEGVSLDIGGAQGYDDYHLVSPRILKEGGIYKMWYSGSDGVHYRILFAT